jgi:hypothetical protein
MTISSIILVALSILAGSAAEMNVMENAVVIVKKWIVPGVLITPNIRVGNAERKIVLPQLSIQYGHISFNHP